MVSHDRHLLGLIADRLLLVDAGTALEFEGNIDDYRDSVLGVGKAGKGKGKSGEVEAPVQKISRKDKRRAAADARERTKSLRKAVTQAEAEMRTFSAKRDAIDAKLADATPAEASKLMKQRGDLTRKIGDAEARWLEASEAVEAALAAA